MKLKQGKENYEVNGMMNCRIREFRRNMKRFLDC